MGIIQFDGEGDGGDRGGGCGVGGILGLARVREDVGSSMRVPML